MKTVSTKPTTVDDYFQSLPKNVKTVLTTVRKIFKQHLPKHAEEVISYGIPAYKWHKTPLYFAGWSDFVSIYPIPKGDDAFRKKIEPFIAGKGTLRFKLNEPLPLELIAEIVKTRVAYDGIDYTATTSGSKKATTKNTTTKKTALKKATAKKTAAKKTSVKIKARSVKSK